MRLDVFEVVGGEPVFEPPFLQDWPGLVSITRPRRVEEKRHTTTTTTTTTAAAAAAAAAAV